MRLECEFCNSCRCFSGGNICECGHAMCWHRRVRQFESVRDSARRPTYEWMAVGVICEVFDHLPV